MDKKPRKPACPRRPKPVFRKTETVWTSDDEDILIADLLHLIPSNIRAEDIRISVDKGSTTRVVVTYDYEIINTKFEQQLADYNDRVLLYKKELAVWQQKNDEWMNKQLDQQEQIKILKIEIEKLYGEC